MDQLEGDALQTLFYPVVGITRLRPSIPSEVTRDRKDSVVFTISLKGQDIIADVDQRGPLPKACSVIPGSKFASWRRQFSDLALKTPAHLAH